jgi:hypothetical protein
MAVQYAFGKIITQGLDLNVDAADPTSYPGSGNTWTSVVNRSITGSLISCSFSSDFKGGIVFDNPSASVQFPGTVANYGTGSFTIEMAFRPSSIEGIHYLVSKNSGSFPNWGVYLSGSGGSGKLFAEYNIDASVSCSVSSSTVFETGSNYFVDTVFSPLERRTYINVEGNYDAISTVGNGTGSLTTTGSLFVGNLTISSSQSYSGSIFNTKVYSTITSGFNNFKSIAPRVNKPIPARASSALALIVGGGGSGGGQLGISGGGGAGGFVLTYLNITLGTYNVYVGDGGAQPGRGINANNGQSSSLADIIAYGGGGGGSYTNNTGSNGASGGGGGASGDGTLVSGGLAIYGEQGNNGGAGGQANGLYAGGGGGAGAPGQSIQGINNNGKGGDGLPSSISGILTYYAGGGGGGRYSSGTPGLGGLGGGANGSNGIGLPGTPNTGGGGGGSAYNPNPAGGKGGSGIVIIRYLGNPIATGGTITSVDGDTIHTFTETGSHTFTVL